MKKNVDITQTKSMIKECIDRLGFEGLRTWAVSGGKPKSSSSESLEIGRIAVTLDY